MSTSRKRRPNESLATDVLSNPFEMEDIHRSGELLDESEQKELIHDITFDVQQQSEDWKKILSFASLAAALASTISYFFLVDDSLRHLSLRIYSMYSAALHFFAAWLVVHQPLACEGQMVARRNFGMINVLGLLAASIQVPYFKFLDVKDLTVWTLVGMNILTMASAVYFRVEEQNSLVGVNALTRSAYKHKSL